MSVETASESVPEWAQFGIRAFTTTRATGSFGLLSAEASRDVMDRWSTLRGELRTGGSRFATGGQIHGAHVVVHGPGWGGWLRVDDTDGHVSVTRGTGLAVTVADCVPVFVAHPSGAVAMLHAGWRGTAAHVMARAIELLAGFGLAPVELHVHLGPAICGTCYEVGPDVYAELTGRNPGRPTVIDLRGLLADQAAAAGVRTITVSPSCTKCDNDRFYSHRAGDQGRQLGVIIADQ
jgi:hypothetical protein